MFSLMLGNTTGNRSTTKKTNKPESASAPTAPASSASASYQAPSLSPPTLGIEAAAAHAAAHDHLYKDQWEPDGLETTTDDNSWLDLDGLEEAMIYSDQSVKNAVDYAVSSASASAAAATTSEPASDSKKRRRVSTKTKNNLTPKKARKTKQSKSESSRVAEVEEEEEKVDDEETSLTIPIQTPPNDCTLILDNANASWFSDLHLQLRGNSTEAHAIKSATLCFLNSESTLTNMFISISKQTEEDNTSRWKIHVKDVLKSLSETIDPSILVPSSATLFMKLLFDSNLYIKLELAFTRNVLYQVMFPFSCDLIQKRQAQAWKTDVTKFEKDIFYYIEQWGPAAQDMLKSGAPGLRPFPLIEDYIEGGYRALDTSRRFIALELVQIRTSV